MGFFSIFKKKNKGSKSDKSNKPSQKTDVIQPIGNEAASIESFRSGNRRNRMSTGKNRNNFEDSFSEEEKDPDELSLPGGMREEREAYEAAMRKKEAKKQNARVDILQPKLITEENFFDDKIDDSYLEEKKNSDEPSLPGGMRDEVEAYEAAMRKWNGEPEPKKAVPSAQENLIIGNKASGKDDKEQEIIIGSRPKQQAQPKAQARPKAQSKAQAQPEAQEYFPGFSKNKDLVIEGPTTYMGDDTKAYAPVHRGKKGSKRPKLQNQIEEVQEVQNPLAEQGFQPVRLAPRTKFGIRQKAGNLAGSAASSVLTTAVVAAGSIGLIPFIGYTEGNASFVSKYGQQSRRHDLIPGWYGEKFENQDASGEEISSDVRRVPTIWAKEIAEKAENEDGSPKAPEITVYAKQPNIGSSRVNGRGGAGHTFLGMRYTRRSPRSERNERYQLIIGFYPGGEYVDSGGGPMTTKNVRIPGRMVDDSDSPYTISRRYPATDAQVNSIIKASETYADQGYNVFERNCTTYVKEMIRDYAHLNTGGKIFEEEEMRFNARDNIMRGTLSWATPFMDVYTLNKMAENAKEADESYAGYGNMKVTKDEIQRYKKSRNYFNPVKKGYSPAVTAENMRRIPGESNNVLGSFYYYGGLPVSKNVEEGEHADASDIKSDVTNEKVEEQLADTGMSLYNTVMTILPEEMQNRELNDMPPQIKDFLEAAIFIAEPFSTFNTNCMNKIEELKDEGKGLAYEDVASFDEIKTAYTGLQDIEKRISRGFSYTFQGDTRIETSVMNTLSMISITFSFINKMYQNKAKKTFKQSEDLGDIRSGIKKEFQLKDKDSSINITPSRYEAYLAIYKSPAAVIQAYARFQELKKAYEDETITDDEKNELDKLGEIDTTAEEFMTSHNYLLNKDAYSQQDLDYIFKLKAREKKGLKGNNLNTFNEGDSSAGIYQSLALDKIFKGIKAAFLRDYEKKDLGNPPALEVWLNDYISECAWGHAKELEMIIRAIRRVTPRHTKDTIYKYLTSLIIKMYIEKVFTATGGGRIPIANLFMPTAMKDIMEKRNTGFPVLVKALIEKIMKEKK